MWPAFLIGECREQQPESLDLRKMIDPGKERPEQVKGAHTRASDDAADFFLAHLFRREVPPKQGKHFFKAPIGKAIEIVSAQDQPPRRSVYMAEHCLGRDDIFEARRSAFHGDFGNDGLGLKGHGHPHG